MRRFSMVLTVAALVVAPTMLLVGVAQASRPNPVYSFTVTPNPVTSGSRITFSGTGCLPRANDPDGTPLTVTVAEIDAPAGPSQPSSSTLVPVATAAHGRPDSSRSAALAAVLRPMDANGDLTTTPKADGTWSIQLDVPQYVVGDFTFGAACDGYNWSVAYSPDVLRVDPDPNAPALIILVDFYGSGREPILSTGVSYNVVGIGFAAGEKVHLVLHSDPVVLATYTADAQLGAIDGSFTLPGTTVTGTNTLSLVGQSTGKSATETIGVLGVTVPVTTVATATTTSTAVATVTVTPPTTAGTSSDSTTTGTSTTDGVDDVTSGTDADLSLAATGSPVVTIFGAGAVLTLLGAVLLVVTRPRRPQRSHGVLFFR